MTRTLLCCVALLLVIPTSRADEPKVVFESWQAAYLQGLKVGHTHTRTVEQKKAGETVLVTRRVLELTVKRYGAVMPMRIEQTCEETTEGRVLTMTLNQTLGSDTRVTSARVEGSKLSVTTGGKATSKPWDKRCLGLYAQEQAFAEYKAEKGDNFSLLSYELGAELALRLRVSVKGMEKTDRLVGRKEAGGKEMVAREEVKLLRAEITTDKINIGGTEVQLPGKTVWLDEKKQTVREEYEFPGLGKVTQYTASKELVMNEKVNPALLPDLGLNVMVPLKTTLPRPFETKNVIYRVKLKDDIKPPFLEDDRQQIKSHRGNTFELHVQAVREPGSSSAASSPGKEYLESSSFIDSTDPTIKGIATRVAGEATTPYRKAVLLEKWVHDNMRFSTATGFPAASRIAKDLQGDCRQHALLLAALLRAAGIPSRTAMGLVYFREDGRSPFFAFHMWTEAYIGGKWFSLDAVNGKGGIAAAHLKMAQASWSGTETLAPLLPIAQALGKLEIEILEAN